MRPDTANMEHLIFHHGGKEYTVYDVLTPDEIGTIMTMSKERNKKLDPLNAKSTKRYFDDTDKMVATILRRCLKMTDNQIAEIEQPERRKLAHAFIKFIAVANNFSS